MLVSSCLEKYIVSLTSFVSCNCICKNDLISITNMRFAWCISNRCSNIILSFVAFLTPLLLSFYNLNFSLFNDNFCHILPVAFCIGRKCNFLPIQKNRLLILRRRDIPRYHFFSLYPHGSEPHRVPSTLFRCNGRIPLSAKFLTCLPLFTLTAPKPSSACSNPPFSA